MATSRPKIPPRPSTGPKKPSRERSEPLPPPPPPPLHRRILFPPSSQTPSPRILHSAAHDSLDPLILDLIALTLRAYVLPWYNGAISRDPDKDFVQACTNVLVHVVQALEVRLAAFDWATLVLDEVPTVLAEHYRDWDLAEEKAASGSTLHNLSLGELFDRIHPHLAVHIITADDLAAAPPPPPQTPTSSPKASPPIEARVDPTYLRALMDHLLRLLLPPEDYRSTTERAIIREVLVGVVFGTVFDRVAQPWFVHALIAKQLEARRLDEAARSTLRTPRAETKGRIPWLERAERTFWTVTDLALSVPSWIATWIAAPSSSSPPSSSSSSSTLAPASQSSAASIPSSLLDLVSSILPQSLFLSQLLTLISLPLSYLSPQIPSRLASTVQSRLASAATARLVLEALKRGLFPLEGGWPAPKEPDPDQVERKEWQRRAEAAVAESLPGTCRNCVSRIRAKS